MIEPLSTELQEVTFILLNLTCYWTIYKLQIKHKLTGDSHKYVCEDRPFKLKLLEWLCAISQPSGFPFTFTFNQCEAADVSNCYLISCMTTTQSFVVGLVVYLPIISHSKLYVEKLRCENKIWLLVLVSICNKLNLQLTQLNTSYTVFEVCLNVDYSILITFPLLEIHFKLFVTDLYSCILLLNETISLQCF